jgi:glyoxylase-like metal-dependent hydrolase (beta-lactamase superfamily II)
MEIERLILGAYQTNCYILRESGAAKDCLLIDAGLEAGQPPLPPAGGRKGGQLVNFLQAHKLNPVAVVLTHGHIDHMAGIAALRRNFPDMKVYIHKLDAEMLTDTESNLSALTMGPFSAEPADFSVDEGDVIELAGIKLVVLHTPGHTPGGICLYAKDESIVFTDDTLFAESVGRTDFPGGSMSQLIKSIKEKLLILPDETVVYPGHGPITTIAQEKARNQYLR